LGDFKKRVLPPPDFLIGRLWSQPNRRLSHRWCSVQMGKAQAKYGDIKHDVKDITKPA
jgi:hypothetical protein